jgi:hypothetical protein
MLSDNTTSGNYSKEIFDLTVLELWHREFLGREKPAIQPQSSPQQPSYSAASTAVAG